MVMREMFTVLDRNLPRRVPYRSVFEMPPATFLQLFAAGVHNGNQNSPKFMFSLRGKERLVGELVQNRFSVALPQWSVTPLMPVLNASIEQYGEKTNVSGHWSFPQRGFSLIPALLILVGALETFASIAWRSPSNIFKFSDGLFFVLLSLGLSTLFVYDSRRQMREIMRRINDITQGRGAPAGGKAGAE